GSAPGGDGGETRARLVELVHAVLIEAAYPVRHVDLRDDHAGILERPTVARPDPARRVDDAALTHLEDVIDAQTNVRGRPEEGAPRLQVRLRTVQGVPAEQAVIPHDQVRSEHRRQRIPVPGGERAPESARHGTVAIRSRLSPVVAGVELGEGGIDVV